MSLKRRLFLSLPFVFSMPPSKGQACYTDALSWPQIDEDVGNSIVLLLRNRNGSLQNAGTGFVVRASSGASERGFNVVVTAAHVVMGEREIVSVARGGKRAVLHPLRIDSQSDVAVLSPIPENDFEWRSIPGLFIGTQIEGTAVLASPGGALPGSSGAPFLDERGHVRAILTEVGVARDVPFLNFRDAYDMSLGKTSTRVLPEAGFARFRPLPFPIQEFLGSENRIRSSHGYPDSVMTLGMIDGACVPFRGEWITTTRRGR